MPTVSANGQYFALGYYPAPADGNLLGGPVSTSPGMTLDLCGTICQGYSYLALENGKFVDCNIPKDCAKNFKGMSATVAQRSPAAHPSLHHQRKTKDETSVVNALLVLAMTRYAAAPPVMRLSTISSREPRAP